MKFGILKSKIEKILIESYQSNTFETQIKNFRKLVLENKKIGTLFFVYDELSSNKGFTDKDLANDFINECIKIYENTTNKISKSDFKKINEWTEGIKVENGYEVIDNLLDSKSIQLETKILGRKKLVESLLQETKSNKEEINLPMKTLVSVANTTIEKYIDKLDEGARNELKDLLMSNDEFLKTSYMTIKEEVLYKLERLNENSDEVTKNRISESIDKIKSEKFDKLNFYRLKTLNDSI